MLAETVVQDALSDLGVVQGFLGFRQHLEDGLWPRHVIHTNKVTPKI